MSLRIPQARCIFTIWVEFPVLPILRKGISWGGCVMAKKYADIDGYYWEVAYPFCAGCPELVVGGTCAWKGNGCRYPDSRKQRPINFASAFFALVKKGDKSVESIAEELGSCIEDK